MKKLILFIILALCSAALVSATEFNGTLGNDFCGHEYCGYLDSGAAPSNISGVVKYQNDHACTSDSQCLSNICCSGLCKSACSIAMPTCNDGIKNQGETGIDCGGPCSACSSSSRNHNDPRIIYSDSATPITGNSITKLLDLGSSTVSEIISNTGTEGIMLTITLTLAMALLAIIAKLRIARAVV
jgi:hypothetical protein